MLNGLSEEYVLLTRLTGIVLRAEVDSLFRATAEDSSPSKLPMLRRLEFPISRLNPLCGELARLMRLTGDVVLEPEAPISKALMPSNDLVTPTPRRAGGGRLCRCLRGGVTAECDSSRREILSSLAVESNDFDAPIPRWAGGGRRIGTLGGVDDPCRVPTDVCPMPASNKFTSSEDFVGLTPLRGGGGLGRGMSAF